MGDNLSVIIPAKRLFRDAGAGGTVYHCGMEESAHAPDSPQTAPDPPEPAAVPDEPRSLADSARGWQRLQLAVLGFIGICGVMWAGGDRGGPGWLQWSTGTLVVLALALACVAVYLVGRVAHPFRGQPAGSAPDGGASAGAARRLRAGVGLTYVAVVVLVVATLSGWWPIPTSVNVVEARAAGSVWCGQLRDAPAGAVRIDTSDGPVTLEFREIVTLRPVDSC
jgi:hypothetical protein